MVDNDQITRERTVLWPADLARRWGVTAVTLWRWQRAGKMPPPDFQTARSGWRLATIEAFERGSAKEAQSPTSLTR